MKTYVHLWHLSEFFLEWVTLKTEVLVGTKTHILCSIFFFKNRSVYDIMSRYRPGVAQRVPGGLGSQIFMTVGTWKLWGRQPYAPAAFTPRKYSWYSFSLEAESTLGPWCGRKEIWHWKIQWHHRESIPGPSD